MDPLNQSLLLKAKEFLSLKSVFSRQASLSKELITCDCSGLFNLLFKEIVDQQFISLKAFQYFDQIESQESIHKLLIQKKSKVTQLNVGDVICWRKRLIPKCGDTGHMALVTKEAKKVDHHCYELEIFDCSKTLHDFDTRENSINAIGIGKIKVYTNDDGEMIGLMWSSDKKKIKRTPILGAQFYL
ncbi:hypothetical protein HBN50_06775 [Halobacteriovorax sp. GB3]|uniref:hypothetical protein n=1 Tax=Halobacteriovorax sp. GB3 TaxID=2719615 RepID=UPI00235EB231|nr:hypothetical protein [Halobacteriovorax sp. GB3]MDD0852791.1 hypothetical protein [Halobacteriovorax sp. GB3]